MIKLRKAGTTSAGVNWTRSNKTGGDWKALCVTPTGRIIAGNSGTVMATNDGIWYSDDNGVTWTRSNKTDGYWNSLCTTPAGRIIAASTGIGIWYSDDNGVNWTLSNKTNGYWNSLCTTPAGRIIANEANNTGIWYSDPEVVTAKNAREKYLDQNGAQEIVTRFKAYCDAKVGA